MGDTINIYCDESCHLENDGHRVMVLGALWCPAARARGLNREFRLIKASHGLSQKFEAKWTKVSPGQTGYYQQVLNRFFDEPDLHFRALVVPDKTQLRHGEFHQTHDDWYYKMYFDLLKVVLQPGNRYRVYIDIKDTRSAQKVAKLHEVISNSLYDFERRIMERLQTVRSHEVELMQVCDLLIGTTSYANRALATSPAKNDLVDLVRRRSGYGLNRTTLIREDKLNLFHWRPAGARP